MLSEPKRVVHVLLPNGTREEADQARQALEADDVVLVMGTASAHTAGQKLNGDVVVIGTVPATIDEDTLGKVIRFTSMSALRKSSAQEREPEAAQQLGSEPDPAQGPVSPPSAPDPEPEPEETPWEPASNGDSDLDAVDVEMHEIAEMCGVELPEGKVTNDGLRDIAESLGIALSVAYVKNADLVALIRQETKG